MKIHRLGAGVFTVEQFLSEGECAAHIARSESLGFQEAAIRTADGERLYKDARNNDRVIVDDPELARSLFGRAAHFLPTDVDGWWPVAFNERWRYYRYEEQQQFVWHQDGTYRKGPNEESLFTFMIYLNDGFSGGSTDFSWESIKPVAGMALVFPHRLKHRGAAVSSGVKYVLRTDIIYAARGS